MTDNISIRIPIVLDKPRVFCMDLQAVARWEVNTGKLFFSPKLWKNLLKNKRDIVLMFWACLVGDDPRLLPKDVARIIKETDETKWKVVLSTIDTGVAAFLNDFLAGGKYGD
jgi:hypothetical protein